MATLAMTDNLENVIRSFIGEMPLILVALFGLVLTVVRWGKLGSGAMPALAGTCCLLILSFYIPFHYSVVLQTLIDQIDPEQIENLFLVSHLLISIALAIGVGLLILGVHLGRRSADSP